MELVVRALLICLLLGPARGHGAGGTSITNLHFLGTGQGMELVVRALVAAGVVGLFTTQWGQPGQVFQVERDEAGRVTDPGAVESFIRRMRADGWALPRAPVIILLTCSCV